MFVGGEDEGLGRTKDETSPRRASDARLLFAAIAERRVYEDASPHNALATVVRQVYQSHTIAS